MSLSCGQDDPLNILKNSFFCCLICIYFFSFFFEHPVEDMGRKCTLEWRGIWEPLAGTINCSETFRKSQLFTLLQTQAHFMFSGSHIIQQISLFLHNNQPNTTRHLFKLILLWSEDVRLKITSTLGTWRPIVFNVLGWMKNDHFW